MLDFSASGAIRYKEPRLKDSITVPQKRWRTGQLTFMVILYSYWHTVLQEVLKTSSVSDALKGICVKGLVPRVVVLEGAGSL